MVDRSVPALKRRLVRGLKPTRPCQEAISPFFPLAYLAMQVVVRESFRVRVSSFPLIIPPELPCPRCFRLASYGFARFQDATPFPPVESLHSQGNSFLCSNPICKAINRDLSEGVEATAAAQVS